MIPKREFILVLVLALASVLTAIAIYQSEGQQEAYVRSTVLQSNSLVSNEIQSIVLTKDGLKFEFEKNGNVWTQVDPFEMSMDAASMQGLVESVFGTVVFTQLDEVDRDALNLDGSHAIVLSNGTDSVSIALGRKTLGGRAYIQVDDGKPMVVSQHLHAFALDMDHKYWRDARVFPDFAVDGERMVREVAGERLVLERGDTGWKMKEPVLTRANQPLVQEWVGQIAGARASAFVVDNPENLELFGLRHPQASFSTTNRQGAGRKLLVGSRIAAGSQDRYVMIENQPMVFAMKWDSLSQLFPRAELLIDPSGSSTSKFDVKQVVVRTSNGEWAFEKGLDAWNLVNGEGMFDSNGLNALMHLVLDAEALSIGIAVYPRESEIATVTLVGYDFLPIDTVRIATSEDGKLILENGDNVLRLHASEKIESIQPFIK